MRGLFFLIAILTLSITGFSQRKALEALDGDHTLRERYGLMKGNSQTYGEYKVIKESLLDGVWRIMQDTVKAKELALKEAGGQITELKAQLNQTMATLKDKEASMEEILFDSTHINVLGVNASKGAFLTMVAIVSGGLIALVVMVIGRMKLQSRTLNEKKLAIDALSHEFDDYKHRAMDRQIKLSRELQDERNKLEAIHRNS
jgi:hypothetical protein